MLKEICLKLFVSTVFICSFFYLIPIFIGFSAYSLKEIFEYFTGNYSSILCIFVLLIVSGLTYDFISSQKIGTIN